MEKKISVIIPAYNVENYIRRCLDSLVNQTYENMEIIVVNDGSTDRTEQIVEEYTEKHDGKVFLYSQENKGQAEARNFGLARASGEYIGFVDSDDFVSTKMYELMYREAEENGCDLVTCGYYGCDDVTGEITVYQTGYRGEFNQSIYENPLILRVNSPYPWNKLYARELLEETGFQFKKGMIFEDLCAVFPLFLDAKKVGRVHEKLYYYIKGRKGGTISTFNEKHGQIIDALQIMNDAYLERGKFEMFYDTLLFFNIRHIYARFDEMVNYDNESFKVEFKERAFSLLDRYFPGWKQSEVYADFEAGKTGEIDEEMAEEAEIEEIPEGESQVKNGKTPGKTAKRGKKRSEIFEEYLSEGILEKNLVLIECYHGNDVRGAGYYIGRILSQEGSCHVCVAAADRAKVDKFKEMFDFNWEFVDMNSDRYLEVLARAEFVINNRAFPGFYRKQKGQRFIFTDFLPSLMPQGKDVTYGAKNMQGIQFSLAQADEVMFPAELGFYFDPLVRKYNAEDCCKENWCFLRVSWFIEDVFQTVQGGIKVAYMPSVKSFPGLKDTKNYLFLSDLKKKLNELDERIEDDRKVYVGYPRTIRRRLKENNWKHIEFFPEDMEPYEFLAGCQGLVGEFGEDMYLMKALGKPVCQFADNVRDVAWSMGNPEGLKAERADLPEFISFDNVEEVAEWINQVPPEERKTPSKPGKHSAVDFLHHAAFLKKKKSRRTVVYVPPFRHRKEFFDFMKNRNVDKSIFLIEKDSFDDNMAAWMKELGEEIMYRIIIRSIVVSKKESRMIKYKLTTKDKLKAKRDRERYLV